MSNYKKDIMWNGFKEAKIELTDVQKDQFWKFYTLLNRYNEEYDLSRLTSFNDVVIKHFIDSIYFTKIIDLSKSLVDIGTGAGFPGIPIKILKPEIKIILAEPRHKRVKFMNMVIEELGLKDIEVYPHKVTENSYFDVDGVITRAFASIEDTFSITNHFLKKNGKIFFLKGPGADKDMAVISPKNKDNFKITIDKEYDLTGISNKRRIIVAEKSTDFLKKKYLIFHDEKETTGFPISSKENKLYKELKKNIKPDGIKKGNNVVISGKKIIEDYLLNNYNKAKHLIIYDGYFENSHSFEKIIQNLAKEKKVIILKKGLFNDIDPLGSGSPILITEKPEIPTWDETLSKGCNLIIPFQDPTNVGSVIRSAVGLDIEKIIITKESANIFNPKSVRTSSGAVFSKKIVSGPTLSEIINFAEKSKTQVVSLDSKGKDITNFKFPESFLLLPGIEGPGLPEEMKKNSVAIPLSDEIESLNATVATSITMYEYKKSRI